MNFKLRPWCIDDLENLVKYANNPGIAKNMTDKFPYPYTPDAGKRFIEFATRYNPVNIFAIEVMDEAAGA